MTTKIKVPLTLTQIHEYTGISVVSLTKYKLEYAEGVLKKFIVGAGRKMKFKPESIPAFIKIRNQGVSRRGHRTLTRKEIAAAKSAAKNYKVM